MTMSNMRAREGEKERKRMCEKKKKDRVCKETRGRQIFDKKAADIN